MTSSEEGSRHPAEQPAAEETPGAPQPKGLLEEVEYPLDQVQAARLEDGYVVYTIVTNRPNSPEAVAAEARLRNRGCTVEKDHESMLNFSKITITAPIEIVPEAEILAIRTETERRAAAAAEARTKPYPREEIPEDLPC